MREAKNIRDYKVCVGESGGVAGQAELFEKVRTLECLIATGEASSTCDLVTEQGISASTCCALPCALALCLSLM